MNLINTKVSGIADAFGAVDITSPAMIDHINDWFNLYFDDTKTEEEDPCMQIAFTTVRKLTKAVISDYKADSTDEYVAALIGTLGLKQKKAIQLAMIGGECWLKPVPTKTGWAWVTVNRQNALIFGRDSDGNVTDIGTCERTVDEKYYYTLLERRTVSADGFLTIRNKLYRSDTRDALGVRVPLAAHVKYSQLQDEYTFQKPVGSIGLVSARIPIENCVDGSDDAVSVYAKAAGLFHNINRNEAQLNGEFDRGESRIITSRDMLRKGRDGEYGFRDHLFVGLDDDAENVGVTIFSPELRQESFLARKQSYLRATEDVIGLKRGLLSEVDAVDRTAKEIGSSEGDYNLTVTDLQTMWDNAVAEAVRVCGILGVLYHVPNAHEMRENSYVIDWGDGVLYDRNQTMQEMQDMVAAGLLQPERLLGWYFNLPADTPEERAKIRADYMPEGGTDEVV